MAGARRIGRWIHVVVTGLFLVGVVVQFLLAGLGMFGTMSLDPHRDLGTLVHLLSLLLFVAALVAWLPRADIVLSLLVLVFTTLQGLLPSIDTDWIAGLHPLNALVLFMLAHVLLRRSIAHVRMRALPPGHEPAATPG